MLVESIGGGQGLAGQTVRKSEQVVQDVFSTVLEEAGREGYASAQAISTEEPLAEQIVTSWSDWFDGERSGGRYQDASEAQRLKQTYGAILQRAYEEGGYGDPKAFLKSLSDEELGVVQRVHALADGISVGGLSEEGALNLLVPPPAQVDMNHDGFTRCGVAYGMRFPDSNTPPAVAAAWDKATAGMSLGDRMTCELQMMLPLLMANIVCDESGQFVGCYEPGDPGFTNPMASPDYSYLRAAQDQLDYLDRFRNQMPAERYAKDTAFWTKLQDLFVEMGVR